MSRRLIIFIMVLALFAGATFIPREKPDVRAVFHQHMVWPAASEETTGLDQNGVLSTHLPILILRAEGQEIPGLDPESETVLYCDYALIHNPDGVNCSTDTPTQTGILALSIRGNSSRAFPKKQYSLKTVDQNLLPRPTELLGMPPQTSWVLNGSYIDRSMIRNYMLYNISAEIMSDYVPRARICEVMITDHQGVPHYEGVYTLIERIKVSEERLNLNTYDPGYDAAAFLMQMNSHIDNLRIEHLKPDELSAYAFDLEYPKKEELTPESLRYIQRQLLTLEKVMHDAASTRSWDHLESLIDMDSFVDYFLINEFFQNYDAGRRSTFIYQDPGKKIHIGPVWDFDGTFNNFFRLELESSYMELKGSVFYAYLSQDPHFAELCTSRYRELRNTYLSEDYLVSYIDHLGTYLEPAARRNCDRWYQGLYASYYTDLEQMKEFVRARGTWLDENLEHVTTVLGQ